MENSPFFADLFQKYIDNKCSVEETDYLLSLLKTEEYKQFAIDLIGRRVAQKADVRNVDFGLEERLELRLKEIFEVKTPVIQLYEPRRRPNRRWVAAAAVAALLIAGSLFFFLQKDKDIQRPLATHVTPPKPTVSYIRHLTLPDGSSVVLHAGSKLEYPASFEGKTREVTLYGEAYFDISHNAASPFIIHTGKVKTIVLGTAFNIKADAKHVIVSVTRGKVRVEDEVKVLAVLTPDQQMQYNVPLNKAAQQTVNANTLVTDWTKEDMVFNGLSFREIAGLLSKRYGVPVIFNNESLKNCKIRASFSGTETLEQVASVLCGIRNGNFEQLADGAISLNGEGCDQ
ncbi:MAG: FecR domain-containing protein [Flavitalea sp.]